MSEHHLDDLDGLPVTSGGEYDPEAGASWAASAGCGSRAMASDASGEDGALSGDVVERVRVGPYTASVQLERRDGGLWIACAMIETESGVMSWCGAATEQEVARHLAARRRREGASAGFDFGRFLNDIGREINRGAQQLARNRTLRRVVRDVNRTLNRPELQPVLAVAQQIPYLGQALGAVRAAATMADQVLGGNPQARGRLQSIRRAAQRGNPIARQALEVLDDVLRAQRRSVRQRAGAPARRHPRRRPRRRQGSPRRRHGARSSGSEAEERAWRAASERWAEHTRRSIVTPPPVG